MNNSTFLESISNSCKSGLSYRFWNSL